MIKQTKVSELANFLLALQDDEHEMLDRFDSESGDSIRRSYAGFFAREIANSGFTIDSLCTELESVCSPRWLRHSFLLQVIEMADPRSPFSPLHVCSSTCCCTPAPKPFDPDDPWGELARIEEMADR
jgi:hypothetical protein